jgi:alkanesulfonate monooxygenase SsuD/methylene tetrahydromethanopterin reductase-like flavin-dependent oxidoreductase (luciferase family)
MTELKFGALCWNQYTDWPSLLEAGKRADRLGYDSLWTWDHLFPIVGSDDGPMFEAWLTITAWAMATEKVRIGLMVGANTFRNPALVAKMVTTLDHISNGRAILGIGAAWFETEHVAFGLPFGRGFPERLRWLGEALPVMRGMLRGEKPSAGGEHYHAQKVRNDPRPIQDALPILVGGSGERVTLKLVAEYADMCNVGTDRRPFGERRPPFGSIARISGAIKPRSSGLPALECRSSVTRERKQHASSERHSSETAMQSSGRTSRSERRSRSLRFSRRTWRSGIHISWPGSRRHMTRNQ